MSTDAAGTPRRPFRVAHLLGMLVGLAIVAYGLSLWDYWMPLTGYVAAIGGSLFLSGFFATEYAGKKFGLLPADRRVLWIGFAVLAVVLTLVLLSWMGRHRATTAEAVLLVSGLDPSRRRHRHPTGDPAVE